MTHRLEILGKINLEMLADPALFPEAKFQYGGKFKQCRGRKL
jgi:hypothetical protein